MSRESECGSGSDGRIARATEGAEDAGETNWRPKAFSDVKTDDWVLTFRGNGPVVDEGETVEAKILDGGIKPDGSGGAFGNNGSKPKVSIKLTKAPANGYTVAYLRSLSPKTGAKNAWPIAVFLKEPDAGDGGVDAGRD